MAPRIIPARSQSRVALRLRSTPATGLLTVRQQSSGQKVLGRIIGDTRKQLPLINRGLYTPQQPMSLSEYGVQSPTTSKTLL